MQLDENILSRDEYAKALKANATSKTADLSKRKLGEPGGFQSPAAAGIPSP